jgi:lipopolysaccharide/colanic/teichoic acid biosynthesis glycosyltransferase
MPSVTSSSAIAAERVQRLLDIVVAAAGLVVLSPILALVAVSVRWSSPGPAWHRAERVGKGGRVFTLYKFRSMTADATQAGPGITGRGDPRVTSLGRWLRATKLDELPQLINVLKGDMSLVGPRPEDPRYVALYTAEQRRVLSVRPGVTSAATVQYRHEESVLPGEDWEKAYVSTIMPDKLRIELEYLERRTLGSDARILWKTVIALFQ